MMTTLETITAEILAKRAVRQARKTTDPRYTDCIGWGAVRPVFEYCCKGCGKTSRNGGSFGFHVRACDALDQFDA